MSCPAVPCPPSPPTPEARFVKDPPAGFNCGLTLLYYNTQQTYTDNCPIGSPTAPISVTVLANTYSSSVSQDDADDIAMDVAEVQAAALRVLTPCQAGAGSFILAEDDSFLTTEGDDFLITE